MEKKLLTLAEVADILRISKLTVWRYIDAKDLPAFKIGRDWRIEEKELEKFLQNRRSVKEKK